jgi:hypothetical protein
LIRARFLHHLREDRARYLDAFGHGTILARIAAEFIRALAT